MIISNTSKCPICGRDLKYYDSVTRIVRTAGGLARFVKVNRVTCAHCHKVYRDLPPFILPYKQYESSIITGVLLNTITNETLGYEDYPCDMTMKRWRREKNITYYEKQST